MAGRRKIPDRDLITSKGTGREPRDQVVADIGKVKEYKERLVSEVKPHLSNIRERLAAKIVVSDILSRWTGPLLKVALVVIFLFVLFNLIRGLFVKKPKREPVPQTPQPTVHRVLKPSIYATDSAVLTIEEEVGQLEKDLDSLQLDETRIKPPSLNFDVNFED